MTDDGFDILSHYESFDESSRLSIETGRLELDRSRDILERHLPAAPAVVLDIGGGPGVYAIWLARRGYTVRLLDPVPRHVEAARRNAERAGAPAMDAKVGDARDLPFDDSSAGAALLMGPMYHLTSRDDRIRALAEARRVVHPGGPVLIAAITRFASLLDGVLRGFIEDPRFASIVDRDLAEGQHRNPTGNPSYFTTAYFHRPEDLSDEINASGLTLESILAVEGPFWLLGDLETRLDDETKRRRILDAARRIESEPSTLGVSAHWLAVARRDDAGASDRMRT